MLEDDTAAMLFEDQTEGEERVINAVQKPLPPLVTNLRTATQEQLANRDVVLRSVENDVWQFQDAPEQFRAALVGAAQNSRRRLVASQSV